MATKKGAGDKPQEYDKETGRYGSSSRTGQKCAVSERVKGLVEKKKAKRIGVNQGKATPKQVEIRISRREYAILSHELMRKNSSRIGKIKSVEYAFTDEYFYIVNNEEIGKFTIKKQIKIVGNENIIQEYMEMIRKK